MNTLTNLSNDQRTAISAALAALNKRITDSEWAMDSLNKAIDTYQRNRGTDAERRTASALLLALHRAQPQPGLPPADKPKPKPRAKNKPSWKQIQRWRANNVFWFSHWHAARVFMRCEYEPRPKTPTYASDGSPEQTPRQTQRAYLCVPPTEMNIEGVFVFIGHQPHNLDTISEIYIPTQPTGRAGDLGYRVERPEGAIATVSHWQVTLRDPATGDTYQRTCRAISADNAVRKVLVASEVPNAHLVDIEEISSWESEMLPYEEYDTADDDERNDGDDSATVAPVAHYDDPDTLDNTTEQFEIRPVIVGQLGVAHA